MSNFTTEPVAQPADSGRVGDISRLTRYFPSMPSHPGWQMSPDPRGEWVLFADVQALAVQGRVDLLNGEMLQAGADALDRFVAWEPSNDEERYACIEAVWRAMRERAPTAALTAQGQGEAVAKVRHFDYRGIARNGFSQEAQMLDGAPVLPDGTPLYTRPATAASPAGVPDVVSEVMAELEKAIRKFPTWPTDPLHAVGVFNEEAGELSKAVLQQVYEPHKNAADDVRKEARQAAAMALRFLVSIDSYDWTPGTQHEQPSLAALAAQGQGDRYSPVGPIPDDAPDSYAEAYIRDWCPDHVKAYIARKTTPPASPAGVPDATEVHADLPPGYRMATRDGDYWPLFGDSYCTNHAFPTRELAALEAWKQAHEKLNDSMESIRRLSAGPSSPVEPAGVPDGCIPVPRSLVERWASVDAFNAPVGAAMELKVIAGQMLQHTAMLAAAPSAPDGADHG